MNIGIYKEHAFLVTNLDKVTHNFSCAECQARFIQVCHLRRRAETCTRGVTKVKCPGEEIKPPETAFEKAFYPSGSFGKKAILWLEYESRKRNAHIYHQMCKHGGERMVAGHAVDGFCLETYTVFQFHGCYWHGCPKCFPGPAQRQEKVIFEKVGKTKKGITRQMAYERTLKISQEILKKGFKLVECWEHQITGRLPVELPKKKTETLPHAIVFDFEAVLDRSKRRQPVSLADTLDREPVHICSRDPEELIGRFWEELERRGAVIRRQMAKYIPKDFHFLPAKQQCLILQWCRQIPVLSFNSGSYDLNMIKKHFVTKITVENEVKVASKQRKIMFMSTPNFKFLDIMNYVAPGTSYDKRVKTYGAELTKSWLPYEWFDTVEKLDYPELPAYWHFYSKLKNEIVLSTEEYFQCRRVWKEKGMKTFADWLRHYNNLDVKPFLEAMEKMRGFYTTLGIDIFKDAVSFPGVSMNYLGTLNRPNAGELFAPGPEAYEMLKGAVVGGPSLVFCRKHEAGVTRIRSHKYQDAKVCRKVLGYDANALYPNTMLGLMPCGKGVVQDWPQTEKCLGNFIDAVKTERWFGFAEVDIEVPRELWSKFEEMPPLFYNKPVPSEAVPQHMKDYLAKSKRKPMYHQQKLVGALSAEKILMYAPLLKWYLDQGLKITAVHRTINYKQGKPFTWFVNKVTENRRKGDQNPELSLLAEVFIARTAR